MPAIKAEYKCQFCHKKMGARELRAHLPRCPKRAAAPKRKEK